VEEKKCDLVAMSTHGHKFLADLFLGTTADRVRHNVMCRCFFFERSDAPAEDAFLAAPVNHETRCDVAPGNRTATKPAENVILWKTPQTLTAHPA